MAEKKRAAYAALVGGVLAEERELRGVSQGAAAGAAGLKQSTWARMEAGRGCTLENLGKACSAFKLEPWKLLKVADDRAEALRGQEIEVVFESETQTVDTQGAWLTGSELARVSLSALAAKSSLAALAIAAGAGIAGYIDRLFEKRD
ncbi:transcriptional regulator with XRE-family HTH domain [Paraburkholderia sp. UCT70]|uniref:helix-turn-helix domain-containing protein n=1 Tax=Paraburkholderia sp. UCT70 TaxID=2991068 RepID=UPI003D2515AE